MKTLISHDIRFPSTLSLVGGRVRELRRSGHYVTISTYKDLMGIHYVNHGRVSTSIYDRTHECLLFTRIWVRSSIFSCGVNALRVLICREQIIDSMIYTASIVCASDRHRLSWRGRWSRNMSERHSRDTKFCVGTHDHIVSISMAGIHGGMGGLLIITESITLEMDVCSQFVYWGCLEVHDTESLRVTEMMFDQDQSDGISWTGFMIDMDQLLGGDMSNTKQGVSFKTWEREQLLVHRGDLLRLMKTWIQRHLGDRSMHCADGSYVIFNLTQRQEQSTVDEDGGMIGMEEGGMWRWRVGYLLVGVGIVIYELDGVNKVGGKKVGYCFEYDCME
ncbi:hypothetical protein Tco_0729722 [Tanacetum coccineum]|uniref:Uncharacterized protein n=1 Tax=Tanacetum coccineum TaxID=301880 RepID=A0ABQ4YQY0_9ASTR